MKKILLSFGLGFILAAGAATATTMTDDALDQLNAQVKSILDTIQNDATVAQLTFNAIETDADRAVKVALNGLYRKVGSQNTLELNIDNLSYAYGDGTAPMTIFRGSLGLDFTKLIPQDEINTIIPEAATEIEEFSKEYIEQYGDAASVRGVVTSTAQDNQGNYTGLTALLSAKIDLSKLPEDKIEEVMLTDMVVSLSVNLKTGMAIDAYFVSNPKYRLFNRDQEGLKEILDKLLSKDEETMVRFGYLVETLDNEANSIVEWIEEIVKH